MQLFWDVFQRALVDYSLPVLIVAYFAKKIITHWLDKDISAYKKALENETASLKQSLESTANLELEKYKSLLETERLRLQISYGGIFEKQAYAILDIYRALKDLECSAIVFIDSAPNKVDESSKLFLKSWKVAYESYAKNRILLPEQLDALLNKFILDYFMNTHHYTSAKVDLINLSNVQGLSDEQLDLIRERRDKAIEIINLEIPKLLNDLVSYMRKTLGIIQL